MNSFNDETKHMHQQFQQIKSMKEYKKNIKDYMEL